MIRLVLGDGGMLAVDLAGRTFGRGAWAHPRTDCLVRACRGGAAKSFKTAISTDAATLVTAVRAAADRRVEALLSSARGAGRIAPGSDVARAAFEQGSAKLVLVAADGRATAHLGFVGVAASRGMAILWGTKDRIGRAIGRPGTAVVAILDDGLSEAIARAIAIEPALLLFDEPLSNLDVTLREETRGELRELVGRLGLTAVYVTHDQEEAFALCDRISVMAGGRILQTGKPRDLYEHPAQLSVGRFLGRNNLIRVMRLSSSKSELGEFKTLDGGHIIRIPVDDKNLVPLNQPCVLAIRPEHVLISSSNANGENAFPATVREINFAGATSSIKFDAQGLILEALALDADGIAVGNQRTIILPSERIALLKNE